MPARFFSARPLAAQLRIPAGSGGKSKLPSTEADSVVRHHFFRVAFSVTLHPVGSIANESVRA